MFYFILIYSVKKRFICLCTLFVFDVFKIFVKLCFERSVEDGVGKSGTQQEQHTAIIFAKSNSEVHRAAIKQHSYIPQRL